MSTNAFVLKSVEMKNWKTFSDATLTLSPEGITGIVGKNGAGKSSFVDAILWCLYNHVERGLTKSSFRRRNTDFSKDVTEVKVTFTYSGDTVEVVRTLRGKNSTTSGQVFVNGLEQTRETGSTIEKWVTKNIHMDVNGFKTAILVPQKELDTLVDLKPSERRASIEKLAGIEEMNLAIKVSREKANLVKAELNGMPGDPEKLDSYKYFLEETEDALADTESNAKKIMQVVVDQKSSLDEAENDLNEGNKALQNVQALMQEITALHSQHNLKSEAYNRNNQSIQELKEQIDGVDPTKRDEYLAEHQRIVDERSALRDNYLLARNALAEAGTKITRAESSLESEKNALKSNQSSFERVKDSLERLELPQNAEQELDAIDAHLRNLSASAGRLEAVVNDMSESINAMQAIGDKAHCPTCQTELSEPEKLIQKFEKIRKESLEELATLRDEWKSSNATQKNLQKSIAEYSSLSKELERSKEQVERSQELVRQAQEAYDIAMVEYQNLPQVDEEAVEAKIAQLEEQRLEVIQKGTRVKFAIEALSKIEKLTNENNDIVETVNKIVEEGKRLKEQLALMGDSEELMRKVEQTTERVSDLRNSYHESSRKQSQLQVELSRLQERMINAKENYERESKLISLKSETSEKLQKMTAVSELLVEYRENRIAKIAPEMALMATELISKMSNNRFLEVMVADDFGVSVLKDDDTVYDVAELSGGEKSIVALALRIAIGALISNENAGLLWLDEVLPAQDVERRDAVLNVLRNLPIQQIVMINHTHEAEEVVNEVVRVHYNEDGSTISYDKKNSLEESLEEDLAEMDIA